MCKFTNLATVCYKQAFTLLRVGPCQGVGVCWHRHVQLQMPTSMIETPFLVITDIIPWRNDIIKVKLFLFGFYSDETTRPTSMFVRLHRMEMRLIEAASAWGMLVWWRRGRRWGRRG